VEIKEEIKEIKKSNEYLVATLEETSLENVDEGFIKVGIF
jgi:hypothetical protein